MSKKGAHIGFDTDADQRDEAERLAEELDVKLSKLMRMAVTLFIETYAKEGDALLRRLRQKRVGQHSSAKGGKDRG